MLPVNEADQLERLAGSQIRNPPFREVIPRDPGRSFRWHSHSYPDPLARWNVHSELEIHLIRRGTGRYIIGDVVGTFEAGQVFLVGSNLPHDWISDLPAGGLIEDRDAVLQFEPQWLEQCQAAMPELRDLDALIARSARGIEFHGDTARAAAEAIESIGLRSGSAALAELFRLLDILACAPVEEYRTLSTRPIDLDFDSDASDVIVAALDYIFDNIGLEPRLAVAAKIAGMSESAFSRYFKTASGQTFSGMVKRLRLTQTCRLLEQTDATIAEIALSVGFSNLSNFNRRFLDEYSITPSAYRKERAALSRKAAMLG